ncbi:hypothetical protein DNTS_011906 [Danionella cerebrum]|uniref:Homeobox domain-containing protein n=1 Tax=Danionella cerebrum TaxID=2873325 RepID=A0A553Q7G4_9TELE|nr:hypothetical protein DNTS_011906 [Danionella translucida]
MSRQQPMALPPGYLYQSSLSLRSVPPFGAHGIDLPRSDDSGSAFAPYASPSFGNSAGFRLLQYSPEPAGAFASYGGSPYDSSPGSTVSYLPYAGPLGPYTFGDPAYRKNATRDATATLKAWLSEHRKNPYPTKGEKIMLAIITKMSLTQVSTWFANARRRLKKENKMSWTQRNRSEDEDEEDSIDLERNEEDEEPMKSAETTKDAEIEECSGSRPEEPEDSTDSIIIDNPETENRTIPSTSPQTRQNYIPPPDPTHTPKPKLWSLAEIATSDKERDKAPPSVRSPLSRSFPARHLYLSPPFYAGWTDCGAFAALNGAGSSLNGLNHTVIHRVRDNKLTLSLEVCRELSIEHKRNRF